MFEKINESKEKLQKLQSQLNKKIIERDNKIKELNNMKKQSSPNFNQIINLAGVLDEIIKNPNDANINNVGNKINNFMPNDFTQMLCNQIQQSIFQSYDEILNNNINSNLDQFNVNFENGLERGLQLYPQYLSKKNEEIDNCNDQINNLNIQINAFEKESSNTKDKIKNGHKKAEYALCGFFRQFFNENNQNEDKCPLEAGKTFSFLVE